MRQSAEALKSDSRVAVNKIIIAHIKSVFDFGHNRADTFVRPHHAVGVKSASPLQNDSKIIYCAGINIVVFYSVRERYRAAVKCADNLLQNTAVVTRLQCAGESKRDYRAILILRKDVFYAQLAS